MGRKSFILLRKQHLFFTKDRHIDAGTSSCDSTCMEILLIFMISDLFSLSLSLFSFVLKQMFVFRDLSAGHPEKDCVCACGVSVVDVFLLCASSSV